MPTSSIVIFGIGAVVAFGGGAAILAISSRIRREVADLLGAFERNQRLLAPLVATVQADRDQLVARLALLSESRSGVKPDGR